MCLGGGSTNRPALQQRTLPAEGARPADEKTGPAGATGTEAFDIHHPDIAGKRSKSSYEDIAPDATKPTSLGSDIKYPGSDRTINF